MSDSTDQGFRWRAAARTAVDAIRRPWSAATELPAEAYARLYTALRLDRALHAMRLGPEAQLACVPRRLEMTPALFGLPYRIPLRLIRLGGRPPGGERRKGRRGRGAGLIHDGDWDIVDRRPIDEYLESYIYSRAVLDIFRDGKPYESTEQFVEMMRFVSAGDTASWQARRCRSAEDVHEYFREMQRTFESIRARGFRSQAELNTGNWFDEIKVYVGRDGEVLKFQGAGHHRLAMARVIGVDTVPVFVLGVHRDWAIRMAAGSGADVLRAIDLGLRSFAEEHAQGRAQAR